jgi:hypothetical protein
VVLEMGDGFTLIVIDIWPIQSALDLKLVELVLGNRSVGLENDTVIVFGLASDVQEYLER